jgi:DNA polymerase-3 subunit beta
MPLKDAITVNPQAFTAAVAWVAKWVPARPTSPIYGGLILDVTDDQLHLSAQGDNAAARAVVPIDGLTTGPQRAIVSGRLLADLAGTFGNKPVRISGTGDDHVQIDVGRWTGTLPGLPGHDYPALPVALPAIGSIGGDALAESAGRVGAAAGTDPTTGVTFSGMHLTFGDATVTAMTTDRYRAAHVVMQWSSNSGSDEARARGGVIALPLATAFTDAAAAFAGPDNIAIGHDGSLLSLSSPTRTIVMTTLEGDYAADTVRDWLAAEHPHHARLPVAGLLGEPLKRAELMREPKGPIRLGLTAGNVRVVGGQLGDVLGGEDIEIGYDGPDAVLGFNPGYLRDALTSAPGTEVDMTFGTPRKPILFTVRGIPTRLRPRSPSGAASGPPNACACSSPAGTCSPSVAPAPGIGLPAASRTPGSRSATRRLT